MIIKNKDSFIFKILKFIYKIYNILFIEKTENIFIQLFRYSFVSGIALAADFGLTFLLKNIFHVPFLIASRFGNVIGLIINYLLNILWVFNKRKVKNRLIEFVLFIATSLIGMGVNFAVEFLFTKIIVIPDFFAKTISVIVGYFIRFFLRKFLLF